MFRESGGPTLLLSLHILVPRVKEFLLGELPRLKEFRGLERGHMSKRVRDIRR
jgi:hypothetical protein